MEIEHRYFHFKCITDKLNIKYNQLVDIKSSTTQVFATSTTNDPAQKLFLVSIPKKLDSYPIWVIKISEKQNDTKKNYQVVSREPLLRLW